jgi:hypothetical protein
MAAQPARSAAIRRPEREQHRAQWSFINVTPTFDATGKITNLAGTAGGGRYGFGALNTVRTAAGAGGPRQIQLGAKFYF